MVGIYMSIQANQCPLLRTSPAAIMLKFGWLVYVSARCEALSRLGWAVHDPGSTGRVLSLAPFSWPRRRALRWGPAGGYLLPAVCRISPVGRPLSLRSATVWFSDLILIFFFTPHSRSSFSLAIFKPAISKLSFDAAKLFT
ncbi:hypothetical protein KL928_004922 [Ogataea angusta]|uniref:Uncharacterized protein n=1 Tax=Pichia angusta TaxID=870730 RepID=A0AAN6DCJ2_PICAN|nr:uncharacterized protein KL928_004922 [Ogataea angusta]KAG7816366.1 hypothetical protein KL928_004922 [Ogataea angusta]